ncbi:TNF receptor-associated factor 6 [Penaeus vannamei]|uniref:TNF receptor-associated factor 6 n=1 Tax=Penaeus vannamei TaxID=6689 RepID=UPI00387F96B5
MERAVLLCVVLLLPCSPAERQQGNEEIESMISQLRHASAAEVQSLRYCKISTPDLLATAQSTANRVLQGVCNPRELNERFAALQKQVVDQFNVLQSMVVSIEDQLRTQDKQMKKHHSKLRQAIGSMRGGSEGADEAGRGIDFFDDLDDLSAGDEDDYSLRDNGEVVSPRDTEIDRYNSTMHQEDGWRVFTYYWRVRDINYKMRNWGGRRSLRSESFYIFQNGYRMYMRIYPNQRGENVYIHVGLTEGDYDANLDWPFKLKHRIHILDQGSPSEDIVSRVWDPTQLCSGWHWRRPESGDNYECVGLGFEQLLLRSRSYIHDDSIVIRLTVFLAQ